MKIHHFYEKKKSVVNTKIISADHKFRSLDISKKKSIVVREEIKGLFIEEEKSLKFPRDNKFDISATVCVFIFGKKYLPHSRVCRYKKNKKQTFGK